MERVPLRELVTRSRRTHVSVHRERALFGSWYEFFPRSEGAQIDTVPGQELSGTFATAAKRLPAIADMGFDVVYLPPIHPVGTSNRKGPNNGRSEEHTSELQSRGHLVCRLLLEKKNTTPT